MKKIRRKNLEETNLNLSKKKGKKWQEYRLQDSDRCPFLSATISPHARESQPRADYEELDGGKNIERERGGGES